MGILLWESDNHIVGIFEGLVTSWSGISAGRDSIDKRKGLGAPVQLSLARTEYRTCGNVVIQKLLNETRRSRRRTAVARRPLVCAPLKATAPPEQLQQNLNWQNLGSFLSLRFAVNVHDSRHVQLMLQILSR